MALVSWGPPYPRVFRPAVARDALATGSRPREFVLAAMCSCRKGYHVDSVTVPHSPPTAPRRHNPTHVRPSRAPLVRDGPELERTTRRGVLHPQLSGAELLARGTVHRARRDRHPLDIPGRDRCPSPDPETESPHPVASSRLGRRGRQRRDHPTEHPRGRRPDVVGALDHRVDLRRIPIALADRRRPRDRLPSAGLVSPPFLFSPSGKGTAGPRAPPRRDHRLSARSQSAVHDRQPRRFLEGVGAPMLARSLRMGSLRTARDRWPSRFCARVNYAPSVFRFLRCACRRPLAVLRTCRSAL